MYKLLIILIFINFTLAQEKWNLHIIDGEGSGADGVRLADINSDGYQDIVTGWEESGVTKIYLNPGPSKVKENWAKAIVGKTKSVEDAFFQDLNNDGHADVITCLEGKAKAINIHWNPGSKEILNSKSWKQQDIKAARGLTLWMFAQALKIDGNDSVDLIAGSKGKNAQVAWLQMPESAQDLNSAKIFKIADAGWIMSIEKFDMDGDGHVDILISDRKGKNSGIRWLKNPGPDGDIHKPWQDNLIFRFPENNKRQYLFLDTADFEDDGQFEIVFPSKKGIHILKKESNGKSWTEKAFIDTSKVNCGGPKAVAVSDINMDGKMDIILTCESSSGKNGVVIFEYKDEAYSNDWKWSPLSGTELGIKYDRIELLDLDNDGDLDLLTCEENEGPKSNGLGIIWYENPLK